MIGVFHACLASHVSAKLLLCCALCFAAATASAEPCRLQTDDTVLSLARENESLFIMEFRSARSDGNWIQEKVAVKPDVHVFARDQIVDAKWRCDALREVDSEDGRRLEVEFASDSTPLRVTYTWSASAGPGPIEQTIRVDNPSSEPVMIGGGCLLSLRLFPAGGSQLEHWWVEKGAGTPSPIGTHTTPIDEAFRHRSISTPCAAKRNSGECIPWQAIHDATNRRGCYTIIATSAHVAQAVDAEKDSPAIRLSLAFDEDVSPFRSVIPDGGGLALPAVFLGCYEGDVDDGCNRLHRWAERRHLPPSSDPRLPLVVNNTWGRGLDIDEASCLAMIEDGAAMGIEVFHMDAGWYRSVGWWHPDPKRFPRGIRLVSDRAREKGMKFGLWVAWTQGGHVRQGEDALCVFEPRMREWFPDDAPADWRSHPWRGRPCCLDSSAAREWCLKELGRIVREYGVDLLKHDQQMITWDCTRDDHEHTESPLDAGYRAAEGLEKVYSALREQFPDLVIENCVNGSCTLDHGIMRQCHYTIAADTYDPLSNRQAFYDASYPLPPRTLEAYVGKHPTPTLDAFRYMLRSGMMGWCTIMIDTTQWSPTQREEARRLIEVYKDTLRPLIRSGNLYHVSPRPRADGWDAIQYMSEDGGEGVVYVFRAKSPDGSYRVRLKGLRPDKSYSIVSEDRKVRLHAATGRELMTDGLTVELPRKESSDILHVRQR